MAYRFSSSQVRIISSTSSDETSKKLIPSKCLIHQLNMSLTDQIWCVL